MTVIYIKADCARSLIEAAVHFATSKKHVAFFLNRVGVSSLDEAAQAVVEGRLRYADRSHVVCKRSILRGDRQAD